MTVRDALTRGHRALRKAETETPYLDAAILLSAALGVSKEQLFARLTDMVPAESETDFQEAIDARAAGVPIAYLTGTKEFYGRDFKVDRRALIPRPDTETLVDVVLELPAVAGGATGKVAAASTTSTALAAARVHDCCTGTGCIAVTIAAERPASEVSASDLSADALELFRENSRALLGHELTHWKSDLLEALAGAFDIIVANPPYVRAAEVGPRTASGEPKLALEAGSDGLSVLGRLVPAAFSRLNDRGYFVTEVGFDQAEPVQELFSQAGFADIEVRTDIEGRPRVVYGRK